jgi:hypothetical protein
MQPASDRPERSDALRRYGPVAIIAVLVLVVGAVVFIGGGGGGDGDDEAEGSGAGALEWASTDGTEPGAPEPTGAMPVTYAEAEDAGTTGELTWPDTCDTERGTIALPSVFALPCVPAFDGDNGGATATGVTAETIKVVFYAAEAPSDLQTIITGLGADDTPEQRVQTLEDYFDIYSSVAELYGRDVEFVPYEATGAPDDVVAARSAATDVIAMEPFAVLGGPALDRGTFAQELADAGIPCMGCAGPLPDETLLAMAPYVWSGAQSPNQFLAMLATWSAGLGETAEFAGGDLTGEPRKIGVIHFDQDPPLFESTQEAQEDNFVGVADVQSYLFDFATMPAKAPELIARYKADGITTIVFLGDPIMPQYLTTAATEQDYYPEWVFAGTALTDTNVLGRSYDAAQMAHAFGISQLPVPMEQDLQETVRLYRWYFGGDDTLPPADAQYALIAPQAAWLVSGLHMAGPELTPETFARGLFRIPPRGGSPANPQVSVGNWGAFPEMDYQGIDDSTEIWWDPDAEVENELGVVGLGAWRRSDGGRRFLVGDDVSPRPFTDVENSVTVLSELPPEDVPPDYPPPAGAPAAGG